MYSPFLLTGTACLLMALLGTALFIIRPRAVRIPKRAALDLPPPPLFGDQFADELALLNGADNFESHVESQNDAYALHQQGEPSFRIASALGIPRADAELLIRIQELRNRITSDRNAR